MARALNATLDTLQVAQRRDPDYRIEIYDLRSTSQYTTPSVINDVVLFNYLGAPALPAIVGPRDFTGDVDQINITEAAGDYIEQGISSTTIAFTVIDPGQFLDPVENAPSSGDLEALGRWLRQGNVVVVREGDHAVASALWPITFTGRIQGQPGQDYNRTTGQAVLSVKAASREVDFLRRINTTSNYGQNTSFADMAESIAELNMNLSLDEIDFGGWGTALTQFLSTQFVQESTLVSISKIMFPDGFMPRFGGDGRLTQTSGVITKGPTRFYTDYELPITIVRPVLEFNGTNSMTVIGLDPIMSKVIQERQELARASITTGFFSKDADIPVRWSEDNLQQALSVEFEVLSSIGDGPFSFGSEDFTNTLQTDGGSVGGDIEVDGSLAGGLIIVGIIAGLWVASHVIPDSVTVFGIGVSEGITIAIGRIVEGGAGKVIMTVLGTQGRGEYRVHGQPYEYVFREIRAVARIAGVRSEDRQEVVIENHLVNSQAEADAIAETMLRRERAKQNLRQITMIHDLKLEPDDVFEVGSGLTARRYMIQSISRTLSRSGDGTAVLQAFEVTPGVRP